MAHVDPNPTLKPPLVGGFFMMWVHGKQKTAPKGGFHCSKPPREGQKLNAGRWV